MVGGFWVGVVRGRAGVFLFLIIAAVRVETGLDGNSWWFTAVLLQWKWEVGWVSFERAGNPGVMEWGRMVRAFGAGVLGEDMGCFMIFLFTRAGLVVAVVDGKGWLLTCTE
jgi:hypothetical protein